MSTNRGGNILALALSLALSTVALAALPVNTTNNGPIIQSGTYLNTSNGQTTFYNNNLGGLWLKSGGNIRGLEVDSNGVPDQNGGNIHLYAPNSIVRLDGNIDVRGFESTAPDLITTFGNGGQVYINAAFVFQKGNIYASGGNGGLVQYNVGSAIIVPGALVDVSGEKGGVININASGVVDIGKQAVFNTSGGASTQLDTNVINIEAGLVNMEGNLIANGVDDRGGTIRLVSMGSTDLAHAQGAIQDGLSGNTVTSNEATTWNNRLNLLNTNYNGDVRIASGSPQTQANLEANGGNGGQYYYQTVGPSDPSNASRSPQGGTILVTATHDVLNGGRITADGTSNDEATIIPDSNANGGNGGTINFNAGRQIVTSGRVEANGGNGEIPDSPSSANTGNGGNGGLIAFSYGGNIYNKGVVEANGGGAGTSSQIHYTGGNGGLIVYSGNENPASNGLNIAMPGIGQLANGILGSIVLPNPLNNTNRNEGVWLNTQPIEILVNSENLFIFNRSNQQPSEENNISWDLDHGVIRSVNDPTGTNGQAYKELLLNSELVSTNNPAYYDLANNWLSSQNIPNFQFRNMVVTGFANTSLDTSYNSPLTLSQVFGTSKTFQFIDPNTGQTLSLNPGFSLSPYNTVTLLLDTSIGINNISFGGNRTGGHFTAIDLNGDFSAAYSSSSISLNSGLTGGTVNITTPAGDIFSPPIELKGQMGGSFIANALNLLVPGNADLSGQLAGGTEQFISDNQQVTISSYHQLDGGVAGGNVFAKAAQQINIYDPAFNLNGGQVNGSLNTLGGPGGTNHITPCGIFCD